MKKLIVKIALFSFFVTALVACKDGNKETATTSEKEVKVATLAASDYNVNVEKSIISWIGSKPTGSHNGTIKIASGTLMATETAIEAGKFSIDMNSIADLDLDGDMKVNLEAHLKGTVEGKEGDFFNVNEFPFANFEITSVTGEGSKLTVSGNLTIKDKTHNIEFPAVISYEGNDMHLKSEAFSIDRTKWGVNYGSKTIFGDLGDKFINDEIELVVELHASKS
jgi:polyisoprenoid-binding protein YceI